jgi:antitoxin component YwqK of YwqJK toxin-antitoxin module
MSASCERDEKPSDPSGEREDVQVADPNEVLIASLEQVDGVWIQQGITGPFTGRAVERYKGGRLAVQSDYNQGMIQFMVRWLKSGTKKTEVKFRDGEPYFETIWRGDGSKKIESGVKDGVPHGPHKRWHANGQLGWVGEFYEGKWHGLVEDRDADGNLIIKGRYDKGTLVEDLLPGR